MTVRLAGPSDIIDLTAMAEKFAARVGYDFDAGHTAKYLADLIQTGVVFRSEGGMLGGYLRSLPCDPNHLCACEDFWWSEDRKGLKLLNAFEEWAKQNGAKTVAMASIDTIDSPAARILAKRGYAVREIHHAKEI